MYKNDLIYITNASTQTVTTNCSVLFDTIQRRRGCAIRSEGSNVILTKPGYYNISVNLTYTGATVGVAEFAIQKDSIIVTGANTSESVTTANTEVHAATINSVVRVYCNAGTANIKVLNIGAIGVAITNASIDIEYLG